MRADLRITRSALQHPGLKGSSFEDTFRDFLRKYLPRTLDVSAGVRIDAVGNPPSRQLDVIVSDAAKTPILYASGEVRVIPIECVYAVIEVKAHLDTTELDRAFENMLSVRRLPKTAYYPQGDIYFPALLYGQEWEIWPAKFFVFAFDSISLRTLADRLLQKHHSAGLPEHERIDTICVLDQGLVANSHHGEKLDALADPGSFLRLAPTRRALLLFYTLVSHYLNQARLPDFRFGAYAGSIPIDTSVE
jgi:hypothetical protein